jgi:hypothetical protein
MGSIYFPIELLSHKDRLKTKKDKHIYPKICSDQRLNKIHQLKLCPLHAQFRVINAWWMPLQGAPKRNPSSETFPLRTSIANFCNISNALSNAGFTAEI